MRWNKIKQGVAITILARRFAVVVVSTIENIAILMHVVIDKGIPLNIRCAVLVQFQ